MIPESPLAFAHRYIAALAAGATGEALAAFYHPEAMQEEFPNRLVPTGARRDLQALLAGAERGQKVIRDHRYEILGSIVEGDRVVLELSWSGTLALTLGALPEGYVLRARFAMFMDLRDGRIYRQRNYDCFEPFPTA